MRLFKGSNYGNYHRRKEREEKDGIQLTRGRRSNLMEKRK